MDTDPFVRDLFHTIPRKPFSMDLTFRKFLDADVNQQYILQKHNDFVANVKKVTKNETKEYVSNNLDAGDNVKICTYNVEEKPFVTPIDSLPIPVPSLSIRDFAEELLTKYGSASSSDASSAEHMVSPAAPTKVPSRNKVEYKAWLEGITETLLVNKQLEQQQKYAENEISKKKRRKEKENVKDKVKVKVHKVKLKEIEKKNVEENTPSKIVASGTERTELLLRRKEAKEKERGMIGIALKKHGQMNIENERQYREYVKSLEIKGMKTKLGNNAFKKWMRYKKKYCKPEIMESSKKSSLGEMENVDQKPSRKRPTLQYILKRIEMGKKGYL